MNRRRNSAQPFSLFAFQDIIMSITAIVILVTMILAIELVSRASQTPSVKKDAIPASLEAVTSQNSALKKEIASLAAKVDEVQGKIVVLPDDNLSPQELEQQRARLKQKVEDLRKQTLVIEDTVEPSSDTEKKQTKLDALATEISRLQSLLDELRDSNAVIFKPSDQSNNKAWIIDINDKRFRVFQIGGKSKKRIFRESDLDTRVKQFANFLSRLNATTNYFLVLVRPSAGQGYFRVLTELQKADFSTGAELIGEKKTVMVQSKNKKK